MSPIAFLVITACANCALPATSLSSLETISIEHKEVPTKWHNNIITSVNYVALNEKVLQLTRLAQNVPWEELEISENIQSGKESPVLKEVAQRLFYLNDLDHRPTQPTLYNEKLSKAIKSFQLRHGLKPDGIIGKKTLAWLNTSPAQRLELLHNNTQRQQQFFNDIKNNYLLVNIPQFQLGLVKKRKPVFGSKVIVGKVKRPTPLINGMLQSVVLNPAWNVPRSILTKDMLPKIQRDNSYLAKQGYEVFDYLGNRLALSKHNWTDLASGKFPFNLRQKPGPNNTLGRVKFYFKNQHGIYLHDTPNKNLFNRYQRTFSSGCIRVEKAHELSKWFANQQAISQSSWLKGISNPRKNKWLPLKPPIPIHLVYWTAWIDNTNKIQFRNDIYGLEKKIKLFEHTHHSSMHQNLAQFKFPAIID